MIRSFPPDAPFAAASAPIAVGRAGSASYTITRSPQGAAGAGPGRGRPVSWRVASVHASPPAAGPGLSSMNHSPTVGPPLPETRKRTGLLILTVWAGLWARVFREGDPGGKGSGSRPCSSGVRAHTRGEALGAPATVCSSGPWADAANESDRLSCQAPRPFYATARGSSPSERTRGAVKLGLRPAGRTHAKEAEHPLGQPLRLLDPGARGALRHARCRAARPRLAAVPPHALPPRRAGMAIIPAFQLHLGGVALGAAGRRVQATAPGLPRAAGTHTGGARAWVPRTPSQPVPDMQALPRAPALCRAVSCPALARTRERAARPGRPGPL